MKDNSFSYNNYYGDTMNKVFKVLPHMCIIQRNDYDCLLKAADEIGAAATNVASKGGQGYEMLLDARHRFKQLLSEMMQRTRVCLEEEEEN